MKWSTRCLLLVVSLPLVVSVSSPLPVQASTTSAPGFYTGWVSFSARIDTTANWGAQGSSLDAFVIEKYQGRGQLIIKTDNEGTGCIVSARVGQIRAPS